jgi:hypothetical protein
MSKVKSEGLAILRGRTLVVALVMTLPLAVLGFASSAMASNPYEKYFSQCPATEPGVELCISAEITSGETAIGSTKVPITNKITQQGGLVPAGPFGEYYAVPAKNGESLSKTEENVPGGLLDIINCKEIKGEGIFEKIERGSCEAIFENKVTGVTEVTELVANEHNPVILNFDNLFGEKGIALTLPARVHLKNPLLGNNCYIGSESHPIQLELTTGTTSPPKGVEPIKGKAGKFSEEEGEISVLRENSLVSNTFTVPKAEGCGEFFSFLIDPVVDAKLGLESPAGDNVAKLEGTQRLALAEDVAKG